MGDSGELAKTLFYLVSVATAPFCELVLFFYVEPPFNYVAASIPPALLSYILYRRERKKEKLFIEQLKSTWKYDMEKSLREYKELLEKKKKS